MGIDPRRIILSAILTPLQADGIFSAVAGRQGCRAHQANLRRGSEGLTVSWGLGQQGHLPTRSAADEVGSLLTLATPSRLRRWLGTDHWDTLAVSLNDQDSTFGLRWRHSFLLIEGLHVGGVLLDTRFQCPLGYQEAQNAFQHFDTVIVRFVGDAVLGPVPQQVRIAS
jgi:hypothetical protein